MDAAVLATHIAILQKELVCALGCTEPIAVAYAATLARAARPSETAPPTGNGIGRLRAAIIGRISEQYEGLTNSLCQSFACARYLLSSSLQRIVTSTRRTELISTSTSALPTSSRGSPMIYRVIQLALMLCLNALACWTYTRILTLRSKPLFCVLYLMQILFDFGLRWVGVAPNVRLILEVPLFWFAMPILMSTDRLSVVLTRILLMNFVMVFTEVLGSSIFVALSHGQAVPDVVGPDTIAAVVTVYVIIISVAAPLLQLLVAFCNRIDNVGDLRLQLPIIALMGISYAQFELSYSRLWLIKQSNVYAVTSLAFCWLTLLLSYLIFTVAMSESRARQELAQRAIAARQAKHERGEIEAMALKARSLYRLRHALANQMRTIGSMATAGKTKEADALLSELQGLAHELAGAEED